MGWAEGLQSGLALGRAFKEGQERRKMEEIQGATAKEMQDYTPAQTQMIQGLDVSPDTGKFNVAALPGAEGQAPTLQYTPRQGLAPAGPEDYQSTAPSSPITIAPQKMTEFLGQRYEGGLTPERMESLRTRAMANAVSDPRLRQQMLAEATRAEREAAQAPLQQKALEQNVALGGVQLTAAQRAEQQSVANQNAQSALAVMRANNERIDSQILAQVAKEHGADFATLRNDELNQLGFNEKTAAVEMKNLSRDWSKAALGGVPGMNKFLADKFDPDKNDNYTPEVIQTKAGYVVKYGDKILGEYGTHKDINTLVAQVHGKINDDPLGTLKTLASVEASNASAVYHRAAAGLTGVHGQLYGMQIKGLQDQQAAREKVNTLSEQFSGLTTAQKNGPEGRALMRDINVANIKAGGQLSLGTPEPEMTKAQSKSWELLQKSDLWQQLERKNDVPGMNKLLVGRGIDPALVGLPGDAGWVPKPETPAAAKPAAAPAGLATEDKTKYIRSKNVRGDYTYTASPRGLTKAEYKAMDEK